MTFCINCINSKYYKFLPILICFITIIIFLGFFDTYARYGVKDPENIIDTKTYKSLSSGPFHVAIHVSIGVLIPLAIDHILTLYTLWTPKMFLHIESYIIPMLIISIQVFNVYFTSASIDYHYYWIYHGTLYIEICVLCNTVFVLQFHSIPKDSPSMLTTMIMCAMTFFSLSLILKLLISLYDILWIKLIWAVVLFFSIVCSCVVLYDWFSRYQSAVKTGLQDQSSIFSFWEMLLVTCFILLVEVYDVITGENKLSNSSTFRIVFYNILITTFIYLFSEIYVLKNKALGMLSMEALETKRSFVRYVSHEIRTPLNTATVGLQLLKKELQKQSTSLVTAGATAIQSSIDSMIELVADTNQACNIAVEILNDLLMYEKIDGGLLVLDAQEVLLWPFVEETLKMFTVQARGLELELIWQPLLDSKIFVNVDRYKMSQVIRNLVSNALKFSKPGQKVIVGAEIITAESMPSPTRHRHHEHDKHNSTRPLSNRILPDNELPQEFDLERNRRYAAQDKQLLELHGRPTTCLGHIQHYMNSMWEYVTDSSRDEMSLSGSISNATMKVANTAHSYATNKVDMVRITVTDSGVGISKENQKRLFNEIVQFHAAKYQEGKGSGIGLWITNKIIKLHGGRIGVESEGEELGSTFYIDIPISRAQYLTGHRSVRSKVVLRDMLRSIIANDGNGGSNGGMDDFNLPFPGILNSYRRGSKDESVRSSNRRGSDSSAPNEDIIRAQQRRRQPPAPIRESISSVITANTAVDEFAVLERGISIHPEQGYKSGKVFDTEEDLDCDELLTHTEKLTGNTPQRLAASSNPIEPPSKRTISIRSEGNDVPRDNFPIAENEEHVQVSQRQGKADEEPPKVANTSTRASFFKSLSNIRLTREPSVHKLERESSNLSSHHHVLSIEGKKTSSSSMLRENKPCKRALIVDDSKVSRKMLRKYCLTCFDGCEEAVDGASAIDLVEHNLSQYKSPQVVPFSNNPNGIVVKPILPCAAFGYDLIILDYFMPGMTGVEVVQRLRAMKYPGKVVGLTGNTDEAMKEAFLSAGADMVLIKPLQGEDLQRIIQGF